MDSFKQSDITTGVEHRVKKLEEEVAELKRLIAANEKETISCDECGKVMEGDDMVFVLVTPDKDFHYCSRACQTAKDASEEENTIPCATCGKEIKFKDRECTVFHGPTENFYYCDRVCMKQDDPYRDMMGYR